MRCTTLPKTTSPKSHFAEKTTLPKRHFAEKFAEFRRKFRNSRKYGNCHHNLNYSSQLTLNLIRANNLDKTAKKSIKFIQWLLLCPPNRSGGGDILFWCGSRRRPHSFVSARYLLNGWIHFDQTCTDTLLGGRNELIRF